MDQEICYLDHLTNDTYKTAQILWKRKTMHVNKVNIVKESESFILHYVSIFLQIEYLLVDFDCQHIVLVLVLIYRSL